MWLCWHHSTLVIWRTITAWPHCPQTWPVVGTRLRNGRSSVGSNLDPVLLWQRGENESLSAKVAHWNKDPATQSYSVLSTLDIVKYWKCWKQGTGHFKLWLRWHKKKTICGSKGADILDYFLAAMTCRHMRLPGSQQRLQEVILPDQKKKKSIAYKNILIHSLNNLNLGE